MMGEGRVRSFAFAYGTTYNVDLFAVCSRLLTFPISPAVNTIKRDFKNLVRHVSPMQGSGS
jgi:hypothetical protein